DPLRPYGVLKVLDASGGDAVLLGHADRLPPLPPGGGHGAGPAALFYWRGRAGPRGGGWAGLAPPRARAPAGRPAGAARGGSGAPGGRGRGAAGGAPGGVRGRAGGGAPAAERAELP